MLLLENLRFDPREQKNDPAFAAALAALGDVYVNDAFGTCHNDKDASMVAVPAALKAAGKPRAVGLLVAKELEVIDGLMSHPKRPLLGDHGRGQGVGQDRRSSTRLLAKVDHLLIGGKMTYTFLKAQGVDVGSTQIADEEVAAAKPLLPHVGNEDHAAGRLPRGEVGRPDRRRRSVEGADPGRLRGRGHRPEDARAVRRRDQERRHGDLERPGRLVRAAGVQHAGRKGIAEAMADSRRASPSSAAARRPRRSSSSASTTR